MSNIQRNTEDTEQLLLSPWQGGHLDQFSRVQPHNSAWLNALLKDNMPQCISQTGYECDGVAMTCSVEMSKQFEANNMYESGRNCFNFNVVII